MGVGRLLTVYPTAVNISSNSLRPVRQAAEHPNISALHPFAGKPDDPEDPTLHSQIDSGA